jgi:ribosomal protein L37AE/L43A
MTLNFIDWDAPIKIGRKNDTCPKCVTKNMRRKGKNRRVCLDCDTLFIRPTDEQKRRQVETSTTN